MNAPWKPDPTSPPASRRWRPHRSTRSMRFSLSLLHPRRPPAHSHFPPPPLGLVRGPVTYRCPPVRAASLTSISAGERDGWLIVHYFPLFLLFYSSRRRRAFGPAVNSEGEASRQSGSSDWWRLTCMGCKLLPRWFNEEDDWNWWGHVADVFTCERVARMWRQVSEFVGAAEAWCRKIMENYKIHWGKISSSSWVIVTRIFSPQFDSHWDWTRFSDRKRLRFDASCGHVAC